MASFRLSTEAKNDLRDISAYLVEQAGPKTAQDMLLQIRSKMRLLAKSPGIGHTRQDLTEELFRFWTVYPYLIVYDPAPTPINIVRVLHGRRDLANLLDKEPSPI